MGKKHASLFSGFGAGDLAATWMGWDNTFWCEIDGFCQTVLNYWFPESIGYGNIKETDFTPWRGKIDVLTGGFPCQPFSVAGQRKGADDDRYLWPEMLRAIREIQPTWVIGENVGGIVSMVQPGSEIAVENQTSLFEESVFETSPCGKPKNKIGVGYKHPTPILFTFYAYSVFVHLFIRK